MAKLTEAELLDATWGHAAKQVGATPEQMRAVVGAAMQVYGLRPFMPPGMQWQLLVPLSYPDQLDGLTVLGIPVRAWDVPVPLVVLLPAGVDSL